jgi:RNA-directed DNA polymerase
MTAVATPAGAVFHKAVDWHAIKWQQAHSIVRRLQARIVKATQAGRWGKVQALQRLLTHSFSAKLLAVKRVTENQGKRTPGVDGVIWETPEHKAQAVTTLCQHGYRTLPLRRVYIPKSNGTGTRPLSIPCMKDRAMQALYLLALDPIAETLAEPNSYGFRLERSTADAIDQCHRVLSLRTSAQWIFEGDIRACFDSLSHDWLVTHIPLDTAILRKWLQAGFMDQHLLSPTETGVPQGGVISPVIMNLALTGLERHITGAFPTFQGTHRTKVHVIRFADDFIITGSSKDFLEQEVQPLVEQFLAERGLALSREKTRVTHIEKGFDFLGTHVRKYRGKLLCTPAKKNVRSFLDTVRGIVKRHKQALTGNLIMQLNPVIRGWAQYHQHGASKRTFAKVDHQVFTLLWQWARRRHPRKSRHWIRDKYFRTEGGNNWVFFGHVPRSNGAQQDVRLFRASSVPIRRHTKIKGEANPYDPQWEPYFEARLGVRMAHNLHGRRYLLRLWKEQDGRCAVCHQRLTQLTGWHSHHLVWRTHGGSDHAENRVLLHPNCHAQVHSQGLTVVKPRPQRGVRKA